MILIQSRKYTRNVTVKHVNCVVLVQVTVFVLFVGAAVTAPQGPTEYRPIRPVVKANYPYRPLPAQPVAVPEAERFPAPQVPEPVDARFRKPQPYSVIVKQSQEDNFDGSFNYK